MRIPTPARACASIAAALHEASADDEVGAVFEDRLEHASDLAGVVQPVPVDLDRDVVAVLERVLAAGLGHDRDGAQTLALMLGHARLHGSGLGGYLGGELIGGSLGPR
jgi:hypothetical protein